MKAINKFKSIMIKIKAKAIPIIQTNTAESVSSLIISSSNDAKSLKSNLVANLVN